MIIKREFIERTTIESFADKRNLTMQVNERDIEPGKYPGPNERFYAAFEGVDVIDGHFYRGVYGNGPDEETAIRDYAIKLSRAVLSIRGADGRREEVVCPRFAESNPERSEDARDGRSAESRC